MTLRWLLGGTAVLRSDMIHASHEAASCTRLLFFLVDRHGGLWGSTALIAPDEPRCRLGPKKDTESVSAS
jgi:hypothetical protein